MILASRFKRFLAVFVDTLIISAPFLIIQNFTPASLVTFFIAALCGILYFGLFESSKYKATPGKKLFNLYVSTADGTKLTLVRAVFRYLLCSVPGMPVTLITVYISYNLPSDYTLFVVEHMTLILGSYAVSIFMNLIWFIPIFFTKKRQGVHELLTSTMVCKKSG